MRRAFEKEGYNSKAYVKAQEAISPSCWASASPPRSSKAVRHPARPGGRSAHIEKQILDVA
jgi:RNA polymerase primary sigma factor